MVVVLRDAAGVLGPRGARGSRVRCRGPSLGSVSNTQPREPRSSTELLPFPLIAESFSRRLGPRNSTGFLPFPLFAESFSRRPGPARRAWADRLSCPIVSAVRGELFETRAADAPAALSRPGRVSSVPRCPVRELRHWLCHGLARSWRCSATAVYFFRMTYFSFILHACGRVRVLQQSPVRGSLPSRHPLDLRCASSSCHNRSGTPRGPVYT